MMMTNNDTRIWINLCLGSNPKNVCARFVRHYDHAETRWLAEEDCLLLGPKVHGYTECVYHLLEVYEDDPLDIHAIY